MSLALLALSACAPEQSKSSGNEAGHGDPKYGPLDEVPAEYLGNWELTHETCEPNSDEVPDTDLPRVQLFLQPDHTYEMSMEGWRISVGTFTVKSYADGTELTLNDTHLDFTLADGRLENWSEGEAVYLCGKIFERIKR